MAAAGTQPLVYTSILASCLDYFLKHTCIGRVPCARKWSEFCTVCVCLSLLGLWPLALDQPSYTSVGSTPMALDDAAILQYFGKVFLFQLPPSSPSWECKRRQVRAQRGLVKGLPKPSICARFTAQNRKSLLQKGPVKRLVQNPSQTNPCAVRLPHARKGRGAWGD